MVTRTEKGAVMAESAIALPLLVFLTVAAVDIASLMKVYSQLQRAVYEGARYGAGTLEISRTLVSQANDPADDPDIQDDVNRRIGRVIEELKLPAANGKLIRQYRLCKKPKGSDVERVVRVSVRYEFEPLFMGFFGGTIPIEITDYGPWLFHTEDPIEDC